MTDDLELRHIIEMAFLPEECVCTIDPNNKMTIRIGNANSVDAFTVAGIDPAKFSTSRAIADLVAELKEEMKMGQLSIRERLHG